MKVYGVVLNEMKAKNSEVVKRISQTYPTPHLATKEDIQKTKVWILSSVIGGIIVAAGLTIAIMKLFM